MRYKAEALKILFFLIVPLQPLRPWQNNLAPFNFVGALDDYQKFLPQIDLIINTTSIRITEGNIKEAESPWDFTHIKPSALAADIVYVPPHDAFLKEAQKHGLAISDSLGMLLHQAAPGFERWFGQKARSTKNCAKSYWMIYEL